VRRKLSIGCLLFAWLCANGAIWNVVQVVAWVKMYHDYSQVMPAARALQLTFDGSAPCDICKIAQTAQDATRDQLPRDVAPGASDKLVLTFQSVAPLVVTAPDSAWPGVVNDAGLRRTEPVPVPPPRV
jgi:hypothetical protein